MPSPLHDLQLASSANSIGNLFFLLFISAAGLTLMISQKNTSRNFWKLPPNLTTTNSASMPVDPYEFLHITHNPDGTITRLRHEPTTAANATDPSAQIWTRDITLNPDKRTWIRLYLPRNSTSSSSTIASTKLPIVLYFHGGGFVFLSADDARFHDFCVRMAVDLNVLVASVNYRLAPEHRLPAAYNDAAESLNLIRNSTDPWLIDHGDLSRCVIMGESAGGNIAYHLALAAAALTAKGELRPLKIKGLVLIQPYVGGAERTESERRSVNNTNLPLAVNDLMWELSLPVGSDRDHEYCNPTIGDGSDLVEKFREFGWRTVVTAVDGDPLYDREMELANLLERRGVDSVSLVRAGYYHGVFLKDRVLGQELFDTIKKNILLTP